MSEGHAERGGSGGRSAPGPGSEGHAERGGSGGRSAPGSGSELPSFPPAVSVETKPFWDATAEGKLLLPRCDACGTVIWYPRTICPDCHSLEVSWIEASGRGTIYSFTIQRRSGGPFRDALPYVLAYVELEEGPRVLTNIVDHDTLEIGQDVEVVFSDTGEGAAIPRFRPSAG